MCFVFNRDLQWAPSGEKKMTGGTNYQGPPPAGGGMYGQPMMGGGMVRNFSLIHFIRVL